MVKYWAVSAASVRLKWPPRKRSTMGGARATIQAVASRETEKMRVMARLTESAKSARRCWLKREEKKGSEAAPAAWPRMPIDELKRVLATLRRGVPPRSWEGKERREHVSAAWGGTPVTR